MRPINVYEYEAAARERLSRMAFDYYASGAHDEITLVENHAAYDRLRLRYRVLRDIRERETGLTLLGESLDLPVLVAPTAFHRLACEEGEVATARAAGEVGTVMVLSTLSTTALEDVAVAATDPLWFQLYVYRDRGVTEALVRRAEAAGYGAIVVTVDAQVWGVRERDVRNRFRLPDGVSMPNLGAGRERLAEADADSGLAAYVTEMFDPSLSWADLEWLSALTHLPVLVKGLVHPRDGRLAVRHGADGVIVSNHGGRQLDTALATIDALPDVARAVEEELEAAGRERRGFPVLVDGGIRRGTDVLKALALGADAVCVGRPVLWGLAVDGAAGAAAVLRILEAELDLAMALCGVTSIEEIRERGPELIVPAPA